MAGTSASQNLHNKQKLVDAMRQLASGVSVITTGRSPHRTGYTGTAVFSLSIDPERLVISVNKNASSFAAIRDHGSFAVNVLRADQVAIADRFAGLGGVKGEDRFQGAEWTVGQNGVSRLEGALAQIECRVEEIIERHSHAIIVGEVLSVAAEQAKPALVYWRSRYASTDNPLAVAAE